MIVYNGFYILNNDDYIKHFLSKNGNLSTISENRITTFDCDNKEFISFKRKIIIYNLLNPDNSWESKLPIEELKKLNELRCHNQKNSNNKIFDIGDYIFYQNNKGEITKKHFLKNGYSYDIKIGKEFIENVYPYELTQRVDNKKKLVNIKSNPIYNHWKTDKLLNHLKKERKQYYTSYDKNNDKYYELLQIKKELANREHIIKK